MFNDPFGFDRLSSPNKDPRYLHIDMTSQPKNEYAKSKITWNDILNALKDEITYTDLRETIHKIYKGQNVTKLSIFFAILNTTDFALLGTVKVSKKILKESLKTVAEKIGKEVVEKIAEKAGKELIEEDLEKTSKNIIVETIEITTKKISNNMSNIVKKSKHHTSDQKALVNLAKKAKKTSVDSDAADILLDWSNEYDMKTLDHRNTDHWIGGDHIHVDSQDHIPVNGN